ncbi:MAG: lipoate--protein ligase family protein [Candidatus Hydrogenedentes bacterium]|nr:lipoate--protein ligase family protein [Candidatus Hydrogenedentota bacterium]
MPVLPETGALRLIASEGLGPREHLALDEAVLDAVETGDSPSTLRLWEADVPFVVMGSAQKAAREVRLEACAADGVPVLRRCTAGGCVLQGPGSLNFSLAVRYDDWPGTRDLRPSYCLLLSRVTEGLKGLGLAASQEGVCDLAVGGLKVSGNAQRRRKHAFLHHGTLLYRPDYAGMARYLAEPADRPEYRGGRSHAEFVGAVNADPERLRDMLRGVFGARPPAQPPSPREMEAMHRLVGEKYLLDAWNLRQ